MRGKDGKMHHRRIHCYVGQEMVMGKIEAEKRQGVTKLDRFFNGTDLADKTTSLSWYDDA